MLAISCCSGHDKHRGYACLWQTSQHTLSHCQWSWADYGKSSFLDGTPQMMVVLHLTWCKRRGNIRKDGQENGVMICPLGRPIGLTCQWQNSQGIQCKWRKHSMDDSLHLGEQEEWPTCTWPMLHMAILEHNWVGCLMVRSLWSLLT